MDKALEPILYVDDEQTNLDGFRLILERKFSIHTAHNGEEALEILRTVPIKVIITDQRMPGMSGTELLKQTIVEYPEIIRMLMTGYNDLDTTVKAVNEGKVFHFIAKPWDRNEITVIIKNAIEHYNLKAENTNLIENLKQQNKLLEDARKKAEVSEKLKTSFLSNISHEIRTPLNGILGFTNLLISHNDKNSETQNLFDLIQTSTNDLLRIVSDIVDISQIESGDLKIIKKSVNAVSFFNDTYDIYSNHDLVKLKNFNFLSDFDITDDVKLHTDPQRLRQIIANLLENAFKYIEEGQVILGAKAHKNEILISVQDTGIGISNEFADEIFKPFFKIEREENLQRGNGLGLSIANKIAELLNCQLSYQSELGTGSTFYIHIPND